MERNRKRPLRSLPPRQMKRGWNEGTVRAFHVGRNEGTVRAFHVVYNTDETRWV